MSVADFGMEKLFERESRTVASLFDNCRHRLVIAVGR